MKPTYTPIVLFVYNRPNHTRKTLEALKQNEGIEATKIYAFADGPKEDARRADLESINSVREILTKYRSSLDIEINVAEKNKGLANSVINGLTQIIIKYGQAIIIEDDIVCGKYFLKYMNDCLQRYKDNQEVMFIGGYTPPIDIPVTEDTYSLHQASVWGWATWQDRWTKLDQSPDSLLKKIKASGRTKRFNFNNSINFYRMLKQQKARKIDSWDILWNATIFTENGLAIYPTKSLVKNIGMDGSGVHCDTEEHYIVSDVNNEVIDTRLEDISEKPAVRAVYEKFYTKSNDISLIEKIKYRWNFEMKNLKKKSKSGR